MGEKNTIILIDCFGDSHIIRIDNSQEKLLNWLMSKDLIECEVKKYTEVEIEEI